MPTDTPSIGGAPAAEALDSLVAQFSERSAFVRELVQNSLDAGAGRIEVRVVQDGQRLRIEVADDGEGMDRATIEGPLLTLFRSTKERDLTKIGKFGVGFVSLFAVRPELVVVDTARDGLHHRVVFDADRSYTLVEVDEPFEGTTVTLRVHTWGSKGRALAEEIRRAVHYWCRFARAEVTVSGDAGGGSWGWAVEVVSWPFTVDAPVMVEESGDGLRAVLGLTTEDPPPVGYYNRGLTLLETREAVVPGVTFKVEARSLEHTLTRDNVRRDAGWEAVIARLRTLASTRLRDAYLAALATAAADPAASGRHAALLDVIGSPAVRLPDDLPCFRRADGGLASLGDLRPKLLELGPREVLFASGPGPLVDALVKAGKAPLLDAVELSGQLLAASALLGAALVDAEERWIAPALVEPPPVVCAAERLGALGPLHAAHFAGAGKALRGRIAVRQRRPGALDKAEGSGRWGRVVVAIDHPAVARLCALPQDVGGPLLAQVVARALGASDPAPEQRVAELLGDIAG